MLIYLFLYYRHWAVEYFISIAIENWQFFKKNNNIIIHHNYIIIFLFLFFNLQLILKSIHNSYTIRSSKIFKLKIILPLFYCEYNFIRQILFNPWNKFKNYERLIIIFWIYRNIFCIHLTCEWVYIVFIHYCR